MFPTTPNHLAAQRAIRSARVRRAFYLTDMIDALCTSLIPTFPPGYGVALGQLRTALAEGGSL